MPPKPILRFMLDAGLSEYLIARTDVGRWIDQYLGAVAARDVGRMLYWRQGYLMLESPAQKLEREAGRRIAW